MALHFHVGERASERAYFLPPLRRRQRERRRPYFYSHKSRAPQTPKLREGERGRRTHTQIGRGREDGHGHPNPLLKFAIIAQSIRRSARAANCHGLAKNQASLEPCNKTEVYPLTTRILRKGSPVLFSCNRVADAYFGTFES